MISYSNSEREKYRGRNRDIEGGEEKVRKKFFG
jgi:hypothetical protein